MVLFQAAPAGAEEDRAMTTNGTGTEKQMLVAQARKVERLTITLTWTALNAAAFVVLVLLWRWAS